MKKKGFTLIELLAVIVILAIVALITIPLVLGVIDRVQIASYKESLRSLFTATDLYIASRNFVDFPEEGINIMDADIEVKNKNFTSGKIFENEDGVLELDKVSNGKYCAGGTYDNIVIVTGSCDALDITPPTITIASNLVTSSSITIVANAEDLESGINGYQFSKDNGNTWTTKQISNVYNFTGLTNDTNYTFKVRVYNNNGLSTISEELNVATVDIPMPTYSINPVGWTSSAVVTITYPEREDGYIYEYSLDNALTWETVEEPAITKEITFNENGNVIARILDGTNEVSGMSYSVTTIDDINPTVTFSMDGNSTYAKIRATLVTVSDLESGVNPSSLKYLWTTSTTTPSEASFTSTFTNGNAIITPEGVTGGYYLWILASDNTDNKIITRSNVFNLDNTAPVITITGPSSITITEGATYVDQGATASDNINGNITSNIEVTSTVNRDVPGTYTVTYNVNDSAGNAATPRVRTVIVQSLYVAYTSIEQTVITSVQNYVTTHSSKLPLNVGNTTEITLTELRSNGYIGVIKDPVNPSIDCNGYILITKLGNNDYDYTPHMKCGNQNTISNTTQDGLIAHYKFDDFQEPTENIYDISEWTGHGSSWTLTGSTYNGQAVYRNIVNNPNVGNNFGFRAIVNKTLAPNEYDLSLSFDARLITDMGYMNSYARVYYTDGTWQQHYFNFTPNIFSNFSQYQGVWYRLEATTKLDTSKTPAYISHIYVWRDFAPAGVEMEISGIQVEKKDHATPFTIGTRTGTIKDYSKNSKHSQLQLKGTPRWVGNTIQGNGAYKFNGINEYIRIIGEEIQPGENMTFSTWIYRTGSGSANQYMSILNNTNDSIHNFSFYLDNSNHQVNGWIRYSDDANLNLGGSNTLIDANKWYHLSYVINQSQGNVSIYVNGIKVHTVNITGSLFRTVSTYTIGQFADRAGQYTFEGIVDDIRIYKRALTAEEINILYKKQLNP